MKAKDGQQSQAGKKGPGLPNVRSFKEHSQRQAELRKQRVRESNIFRKVAYMLMWDLCQLNSSECFVDGGATGKAEKVKREWDDEEEKSGHFPERCSATTERVWAEGLCACYLLVIAKFYILYLKFLTDYYTLTFSVFVTFFVSSNCYVA